MKMTFLNWVLTWAFIIIPPIIFIGIMIYFHSLPAIIIGVIGLIFHIAILGWCQYHEN